MSKKQAYNKVKIDLEKYVNVETGETLASEHPEITSVNKINNDLVKYKSESFFIIDDDAMNYLKTILSKSDMYHVLLMTQMVGGGFNYLYDKSFDAHNRASLQKDLAIARTSFSGLMTRLNKEGVIVESNGHKGHKPFKYLMLNPNLARRTNMIKSECAKLFETFNKNSIKPSKEFGD